eukprot:5085145-Pleurochrysis_carterae.AAC.1
MVSIDNVQISMVANRMCPIGSRGGVLVPLQQLLQLLSYLDRAVWGYGIQLLRCPIRAPHTFLGSKPKIQLAISRYPSDIAIESDYL